MNLAKLDAAIAHIEAHPDEWRQDMWLTRKDCGTAACLAGIIALLDGWEPDRWERQPGGFEETASVVKDGRPEVISFAAMEALGVDTDPADYDGSEYELISDMFGAHNSLDDIKRMRDEAAGRSVAT